MLQSAFGTSYINRASVFERHKRFKESRESVRDDDRCGRKKGSQYTRVDWPKVEGYYVKVLREIRRDSVGRGQHSSNRVSGNTPVHNSLLVTDYLTKMGINTVLRPPPAYILDIAPCDFWLFPKLTGCRYETIVEMKEAVTKVIDTLTPEDFHRAFQKLLKRYNKCIAAGGYYFEGD